MWSIVERRPDVVQVPLVVVGTLLTLVFGRRLPAVFPPLGEAPGYVSPVLYDWSTLQAGIALIVLGLVLTNRSVFQRVRLLQLPPDLRHAALGCAVALASPWLTALVLGPLVGFADQFTTLWYVTFVGGWAGLGGLVVIGFLRIRQVYVTPTDRFPYARVDLSRREAIKGGAMTALGTGAVVTAFAAGRLNLGERWPAYHGNAPVSYEHEALRMQAVGDPARRGESITVEVTNTGTDESVTLGCHNPWALQAYEDGSWHHVSWTAGRYYQACATQLAPGDTTTVTVPLSTSAIRERRTLDNPARKITPGTYRLVLLGTRPYLAINVQVLPRS